MNQSDKGIGSCHRHCGTSLPLCYIHAMRQYTLLRVAREGGLCTCTMHHKHPACVMTIPLFLELDQLIRAVDVDDAIQVFVLRSADPEFFISHFDVTALLEQITQNKLQPIQPQSTLHGGLGPFHKMCQRLKKMNKVSIVEVAGRAGGGGCELASCFDMRFGVDNKTILNQMEVPLGILPGGSGTVSWPHLVGRSRALEVILGGIDVSSSLAVEWGWLNRSFPTRSLMEQYVQRLASRIASFPTLAVANAKRSIMQVEEEKSMEKALVGESYLFAELMNSAQTKGRMELFLERGGQTRQGERRVAELLAPLPSKL